MIELLEKDFEEKYVENKKSQSLTSLLENLSLEEDYQNVLVLILKPNYETDFSNFEMFSVKGIDFVKSACSKFETKIVDYNTKDDVIDVIKQNLNEQKYVLTLFSDTPLVTKKTVLEIVDYFLIKKLCSLKFNRGFMFETAYLKTADKIYNPLEQSFCEEDFVQVFDSASFSYALNILRHRIISYHQANGVVFLDPNSASIDAMVNIEKNVIIGENVKILGKSVIKSETKLFNSKLEKVIVEEKVLIENSIVENSVILKNCKIKDYSIIKNQTIAENLVIENEKRV